MKLTTTRLLAALLALCLVATACGSDESDAADEAAEDSDEGISEDDSDSSDDEGDEEAEDGSDPVPDGPSGTLKFANSIAVNTLNPHDDQTPATFSFYTWIYEGLVRQAPNGEFEPWLAQSWEVSDDGLTIDFVLQEDVTFSDGEPFNAEAVKANLEFVKTAPPDQVIPPVAGQLANVTEVEVVDEYEVALHLGQPGEIAIIAWLGRNSGLMVSPNSLGTAATNPIGTGPYVYNADESAADLTHLVLDGNEDYWQPELVGIETVEMDVINDSTARKQAFEAGQYDLATAALNLGEPSTGEQVVGPSVIFSFTVVDWEGKVVPALANKDVRCAMAQALNREGLVEQVKAPAEAVRYQWAGGEGDYAWIDDLDVPSFDIEEAAAAFEETGEAGFEITNGYLPNTPFEAGSVVWSGGLNELGITLTNEPFDPPSGAEMFTAFTSARYPVQVIPINEAHPLMTLQQRAVADGTLNPSKSVPDGVEELVESASGKSNADAEEDIAAAWQIMLEECIWIPWFTLYDGYWVQDNVTGVEKVVGIPIGLWPQGIRVDG